jgi:bacterial/archaeal transporter family protein
VSFLLSFNADFTDEIPLVKGSAMPAQYLIIISILGWGIGCVFAKIANTEMHPIIVSTISTGIYLLLISISFMVLNFDKTTTTSGVVAAVISALLMCAGSISYFFALKAGGGAGIVTATTSLYPAVTILLSMIFLKEKISFNAGIGIVFALLSFWFLGKK